MKVAVSSESPADEAALRVLIDAVRGRPIEPAGLHTSCRTHGYTSVVRVLPSVIKDRYFQTDVDGLVVLVDSDDSPLHRVDHELPGGFDSACRLCLIRGLIGRTLTPISARRADRPDLWMAVGLAVPAIEAWWRCGLDPHATEQAWPRGVGRGTRRAERASLKREVYGTDRPSLPLATERMEEAARRLAADLAPLERSFPVGFGDMARAVRAWPG